MLTQEEEAKLLSLCLEYLSERRLPRPLPSNREEYESSQKAFDAIQRNEEAFDAWFDLDHEVFVDPTKGWKLILMLLSKTNNQDDCATIGAGVLQTFVFQHGSTFAANIASEAERNPRLREALRLVRGIEEHPELADRLRMIFGGGVS